MFTSSRTLRALQYQEDYGHRLSPHSPAVSSGPPSPSTPATSPYAESYLSGKQRASLTLSQLVRHSEGAVDARRLLGPKMRAAGFVRLPDTLPERSSSSTPSSPSTFCSVSAFVSPPKIINPPKFPPIVFINPTAVATAPMWEYQREMSWSLAPSDREPYKPGYASSNASSNASSRCSNANRGGRGSAVELFSFFI